MYITNKEILRCLFDDEKVHHAIYMQNDFGTSIAAYDENSNIVVSLDNIGICVDNDDLIITEYDDENNAIGACAIPLPWLLRNCSYTYQTR